MRRIFPIIFGLLALFWAAVGAGDYAVQHGTLIAPVTINDIVKAREDHTLRSRTANYDGKVSAIGFGDYHQAQTKSEAVFGSALIGALKVPSVGINLPILAGLSDTNLALGVATYRADQQLGKHNYIVASHNLVGINALLNPINKAKVGDLISATDYHRTYVYRITKNIVVEEHQTKYLAAKVSGKPQLTLFRCEGPAGTKYRRVVVAKLMKTKVTKPIKTASVSRSHQAGVTLLSWCAALCEGFLRYPWWFIGASFGLLAVAWVIDRRK